MGKDVKHRVYENRVRRMAARQGLALIKSRRRDPRALDYGKYRLVSDLNGAPVFGHDAEDRPAADLEEIESWLLGSGS